jgi:hypothetical protein
MTHDLKRMLDVAKNPTAAFDYEVAQEIASALGRLGRALETALAALAAFDERHGTMANAAVAEERRALVASAGHALWQFTVQREACGLRDTRQMLREYRVPAEVQRRMGMLPPEMGRPARRRPLDQQ